MRARESRPGEASEAAPEVIAATDSHSTADTRQPAVATLDEIHTVWLSGWDSGYTQGRQHASEELARQWLHDDARRWTEQAAATARGRHGDGWADEIDRQAAGQ